MNNNHRKNHATPLKPAVDRKSNGKAAAEVSAKSKPCGNFEAEVKKAARQVADANKFVDAAEAQVEKAEAAAGTARVKRDTANGNRLAKLWLLGELLDKWEKAFGPHKHRGPDTFFARAKKACGNDDLYYRARDIRGPHGFATEEAARQAGQAESQQAILDRIAALKRAAKPARSKAARPTAKATARSKTGQTRPPATPTTNGKIQPATPTMKLVTGLGPDNQPAKPLTAEELKLATEKWLCLFSPGSKPTTESIRNAILLAVDDFFPGGMNAAVPWLTGVQRVRKLKIDLPEEDLDVPPTPSPLPPPPPPPKTPKPKKPLTPSQQDLCKLIKAILKDAASHPNKPGLDLPQVTTSLLNRDYKSKASGKALRLSVQRCLADLVEQGKALKSQDRRYSIKPQPVV